MTANIAYDAKIIAMVLNESATELFVRSDSDILSSESTVDELPDSADSWRGKNNPASLKTTSHYNRAFSASKLGLGANNVNLINMDVGQAYTTLNQGWRTSLRFGIPTAFQPLPRDGLRYVRTQHSAVCPCMAVASQKAIEEKPEAIKAWLKAYFNVVGESKLHRPEAGGCDL
jgi:ABC-type nitrate/sulfonate/bicarbonate transport system substrate-binding protein